MAKVARLDDAFSDVFQREANPVEVHSLQQKHKKRRKRKGKKKMKKKTLKFKDVGHKILISEHARAKMSYASGKKGMLSCKCLF